MHNFFMPMEVFFEKKTLPLGPDFMKTQLMGYQLVSLELHITEGDGTPLP